jgi:hypothetical protein
MGSKPSSNFQRDRPESGGADRDENLENSGVLELNKQTVTKSKSAEAKGPAKPAPTPENQADGSEEKG